MFNVQTINCMRYSEPGVIQTRSQSHNEKNTHGTLTAVVKKQQFPLLKKKLFGRSLINEEKRKQGNKKEKLNGIITLDGENSKKVEWQHDIGLGNFT